MLTDDCVTLRIEAIKRTLSNISQNWDRIPKALIKQFMSTVSMACEFYYADNLRLV